MVTQIRKIEAPEVRQGRAPIYPFGELKPGYAFPIAVRQGETRAQANQRVRAAAGQWGRRHGGIRFLVAQAKDGNWYCWRVEG